VNEQTQAVEYVEVNGLNIAYCAQGEGEPVLFLHGWPTYSYLWRQQLPALAGEGFRACALDLPGFGDSDKPPDVSYTLDFQTATLEGFLDAMDIARTALVCHDIGGPIGLLFAVRHPERLSRLVVMDTTPYTDVPPVVRLMMLGINHVPGVGRAMVSRRGLRLLLNMGTAGRGVITDAVLEAYNRPFTGDGQARKVLLHTFTDFDLPALQEAVDNYKRITCPTLILWGEKDPTAPLSLARRLRADIVGAQLETIPNCGHFLSEDKPQAVNRHLLAFLQS
jgi:pimeloyl-ACP methyl ester carboxylesterase